MFECTIYNYIVKRNQGAIEEWTQHLPRWSVQVTLFQLLTSPCPPIINKLHTHNWPGSRTKPNYPTRIRAGKNAKVFKLPASNIIYSHELLLLPQWFRLFVFFFIVKYCAMLQKFFVELYVFSGSCYLENPTPTLSSPASHRLLPPFLPVPLCWQLAALQVSQLKQLLTRQQPFWYTRVLLKLDFPAATVLVGPFFVPVWGRSA